MEIYFGGCEFPKAIHLLADCFFKNIIFSYASKPSQRCWDLARHYGMNIMLDSGAFSLWKKGVVIDNIVDQLDYLHKYMAYIDKHKPDKHITFDMVGCRESTGYSTHTCRSGITQISQGSF